LPGKTGVFIEEQDWADLANEIVFFDPLSFDSVEIKKHAENFSRQSFKKQILEIISKY